MTPRRFCLVLLSTLLLVGTGAFAQRTRGIAGKPAPSLAVNEWINLPEGTAALDIDDLRGKVVYLYGFQSWCPGCHARGFPTLQKLIKHYEGDDSVAFVAVQTAFEGFSSNTPERAWSTARRYKLDIPVGHSGSAEKRSELMRDYRTGGTPWTIIIDPEGVVRYNDFHIEPEAAIRLIDSLGKPSKEESSKSTGDPAGIKTLPKDRGGQNVLGQSLDVTGLDRWPRPVPSEGPAPAVTLYRWWTDTCPWCEASLPAIESLRNRYEEQGLRTVAVYHPKPPRPVEDETILEVASRIGYAGPVSVDQDWSVLREQYLDKGNRTATSITLLVDRDGVIRFVHPGPVFFPSSEEEESRENADYRLLEQAIAQMLKEDQRRRTKVEPTPVKEQGEPGKEPG